MGNSPLSGQGVNEAHDSRDMEEIESKDVRPNGDKLAAENNTKIDGTSNSMPSHVCCELASFLVKYSAF